MYERLKRMANHPKFDGLGAVTQLLFDEKFLPASKDDATIERAIGLLFRPNRPMVEQVFYQSMRAKLDRVRQGSFQDYSRVHDGTFLEATRHIFDTNEAISRDERRQTLEFITDYAIVVGLTEYPLVQKRGVADRVKNAAQIAYTLALYGAANDCLNLLEGRGKRHPSRAHLSNLNRYSCDIGGYLRDMDSLSELMQAAYILNTDGTLSGLRNVMDSAMTGGKHKDKALQIRLQKMIEKADLMDEISKKSELIAQLFNELYAATIPGYGANSNSLFTKGERRSEKVVTAIVDLLSPVLSKLKGRRDLSENKRVLLEKAYEFARHRPDYVLNARPRNNHIVGLLYIPSISGGKNIITYPTSVVTFLKKNGFNPQFGNLPETTFLQEHGGGYVARARLNEHTYVTGFVDCIPVSRVKRGEEPDVIGGFQMPLRYFTVQGAPTNAAQVGRSLEGFLRKNMITAYALDSDGILNALHNIGLGQPQIEQLQKVGALSRASPALDLVMQQVIEHPKGYATVGYKR